ncbi:acetyl-CoA/propionyl-CoA carboxylase biotin carboxyl carrier protein [Haloactinospora alba]|uniref:biotin carboxylase n=1 Tax=Haloactinospora alba TaxID=405555 RepID=A0A543NJZ9_9ACTN|nr:biotin carboxylase N-terminal domain-containing protein [Haloactinospora alba]TQN32136.1 acetyl-CoA/propionyl-CoA carboxylase biotin carboxyl carrier protein [Haloactinospora alba]
MAQSHTRGTPLEGRTLLVANRGEIAVRIARTARRLGMRTVAVYSDGDPDARHTRAADAAVRLGGADLAESYLSSAAVVDAAQRSGATMVHPGYGFLAESAELARACSRAGLVFVGPPASAIETMGDKIRAKTAIADAGVPLLPGFAEEARQPLDDSELHRAAEEVGYPLLIKPAAGGGGKGMKRVAEPAELTAAAAAARREARSSFGDDTLLVERLVQHPRHIEIQVLADREGNTVHLGERECSLQRRHQKIVEEAPSPLLTGEQRAAMGEAAVAAARACGYSGAGTVEFVASVPEHDGPTTASEAPPEVEYFFLEMNTRLQVEHPVTEEVVTVAGRKLDLVEWQLLIAAGGELPFSQDDVGLTGHAVESRVYAEAPDRDFLPTGGRVLLLSEPAGDGVRVDSGIGSGTDITSAYDPMLAKVITRGPDRDGALALMDSALADYTLLGCGTNVAFLRRLLRHPEVVAGELSTELTERVRAELTAQDADVPPGIHAAVAMDRQLDLEPAGPVPDRFDVPDGWRPGGTAWTTWRLSASRGAPVPVALRRLAAPEAPPATATGTGPVDYEVSVGSAEPVTARAWRSADGRTLAVHYDGWSVRYTRAADGGTLWLGYRGRTWSLREEPALAPIRTVRTTRDGAVRSPMPGTVLSVPVSQGENVAAGSPVVIVEAMKMEHTVTAPIAGVVSRVDVVPGRSVSMDAEMATITPPETSGTGETQDGPETSTTTREE